MGLSVVPEFGAVVAKRRIADAEADLSEAEDFQAVLDFDDFLEMGALFHVHGDGSFGTALGEDGAEESVGIAEGFEAHDSVMVRPVGAIHDPRLADADRIRVVAGLDGDGGGAVGEVHRDLPLEAFDHAGDQEEDQQ